MFGFGLIEFLIVSVLVILLVPPRDLPAFLNKVGYWIGKIRKMSGDLQYELNNLKSYTDDLVKNPLDDADIPPQDAQASDEEEKSDPETDTQEEDGTARTEDPESGECFPDDTL